VALIDPTAYLWFTKGDLTVSYSDQAFFTSDQVGWRFTERADGMPWLRNPITLADPQGSFTQSPFVYFND
jgi:HK97 family phage major capsid protein